MHATLSAGDAAAAINCVVFTGNFLKKTIVSMTEFCRRDKRHKFKLIWFCAVSRKNKILSRETTIFTRVLQYVPPQRILRLLAGPILTEQFAAATWCMDGFPTFNRARTQGDVLKSRTTIIFQQFPSIEVTPCPRFYSVFFLLNNSSEARHFLI